MQLTRGRPARGLPIYLWWSDLSNRFINSQTHPYNQIKEIFSSTVTHILLMLLNTNCLSMQRTVCMTLSVLPTHSHRHYSYLHLNLSNIHNYESSSCMHNPWHALNCTFVIFDGKYWNC
jgi:hypothetical protein